MKPPLRGGADKRWVTFEDIASATVSLRGKVKVKTQWCAWEGKDRSPLPEAQGKVRTVHHSPALKYLHPQSLPLPSTHLYPQEISQGVAVAEEKSQDSGSRTLGCLSESLHTLEVLTVATESSWWGFKFIPDSMRTDTFSFVKYTCTNLTYFSLVYSVRLVHL